MTRGLALSAAAAAVAWLATTTGVAALFASAVPLRDHGRTTAPVHGAVALQTPVRSLPARRALARPDTAEDDTARDR